MKSFAALKAKAADAVKGSVERIQAARRQYYAESLGDPVPLSPEDVAAGGAASLPQAAEELLAKPDPALERLLHKVRSPELLEQFLLIPPENYTAQHQVKVLAATYNVNGRAAPEGLNLSPWLGGGRYADVVAVGFQEIVPLNATNIVLGTTMASALAWDAQVAIALNGSSSFISLRPGAAAAADLYAGKGRPPSQHERVRDQQPEAGAEAAGAAHAPADGEAAHDSMSASAEAESAAAGSSESEAAAAAADLGSCSRVGEAAGTAPSIDELLLGPLPVADDGMAGFTSPDDAGTAGEGVRDLQLADPAGEDPGAIEKAPALPATPVGDEEAGGSGARPEGTSRLVAAAEQGSGPSKAGSGSAAGLPAVADTEFVQVASVQMVGVYLSVWVRRSLLPHVRGVQVTSVATGALGYFGNKGAVAARMRIFDSGICFINSHLSSGEAEGDELRRNYDFAEVVRRGYFPPEDAGLQQQQQQATAPLAGWVGPKDWGGALHILDCEYTIWMGDLNYRLQGISGNEVLAAIQAGDLDTLLARDQLQLMMRSGQAFHGWQEHPITFPPTFKLKRGTSQYLGEASDAGSSSSRAASSADLAGLQDVIKDEQSTLTLTASQAAFEASQQTAAGGSTNGKAAGRPEKEKVRTPAWTDRILWHSSPPAGAGGGCGGGMQQLTYSAAEGVTVSDHRPVAGAFFVEAREYVQEQVEAALEVARRVVDAREMAAVPHCAAQPTSMELGTLEFGEVCERQITLTNTAQAPAHFTFVSVPPGSARALPPWLSAQPMQGCVPVGASISITLRACVVGGPGGAAEGLVAGEGGAPKCALDCILVLRVEGGNDVFLTLSGRYTPSCFGLSWGTLAGLPRLVSAPSHLQSAASGGVEVGGDTFFDPLQNASRVPPELIRLTDLLRHDAWLATSGLFVRASDLATAAAARRMSGAGGGHFLAHATPGAGGSGSGGCASPRLHRQQHEAAGMLRFNSLSQPGGAAAGATAAGSPSSPCSPAAGSSGGQLPPPPQLQLVEPSSPTLAHRQQALIGMRRALDSGGPFPGGIDAHDAAAALLALFAEMPQPLLPPEVAQVCDVCVPSAGTAASLLLESASATELAVLCHMLLLMVEALAPENRHHNGLSPASLAAILAEIWFPALPPAAAQSPLLPAPAARGPAGAPGAGASALSVAEISLRRIEFVQLLLEDPAVLQALCAAL